MLGELEERNGRNQKEKVLYNIIICIAIFNEEALVKLANREEVRKTLP